MAMSLPRRRFMALSGAFRMSIPSKRMLPQALIPDGNSFMAASAVIDLPEPDSPTSPITSPASMERSMPRRIGLAPAEMRRPLMSSRLIARALFVDQLRRAGHRRED